LDLVITNAVRNVIAQVIEPLVYAREAEGGLSYHGPFLGKAPPIFVDEVLVNDAVHYFGFKDDNGEIRHSVVVELNDYLIVIEAPLDEAHASAVIAEIRRVFGDKQIRYVVNTHAHFDAAGGLRTYAAEGATIITQDINKAYLERVLALPRTISPDE